MDKKYVADKREKSKKYKNPKYNKKAEVILNKNTSIGDLRTSSKRVLDDDHKPQEILEDVVPPNNWTRYELTTKDDDHYTAEGADYETLLLAPVSGDSHFKFKSEQNWDEDIKSKTDLSKYFTLNIGLLNDGVACVPFIKRHGYDDSIVSPLELEVMKSTSEANLKKYHKLLERKFAPKSDIIITKNNVVIPHNSETPLDTKKTEEIITPKIKTENIKVKTEPHIREDDVDDLLNLKCADLLINEDLDIKVEDPLLEKIEIGKVVVPQPAADLEQWLDDILDD